MHPVRTSGEIYARQHPDGPLSHLWVLQANITGRIFLILQGMIPMAGCRASRERTKRVGEADSID